MMANLQGSESYDITHEVIIRYFPRYKEKSADVEFLYCQEYDKCNGKFKSDYDKKKGIYYPKKARLIQHIIKYHKNEDPLTIYHRTLFKNFIVGRKSMNSSFIWFSYFLFLTLLFVTSPTL